MTQQAALDLPGLPKDETGPVFAEPWQAQAFAMAVSLHDEGLFTWPEWVAVFSQQVVAAQQQGDPDLGDTYYLHWLATLERLCTQKSELSIEALGQRKEAWRQAYLTTPHGQAVQLP
jgi:nitrile hydratase accessory protein